MSKKQWLALLMIFTLYLLLGATTIYYNIEGDEEFELLKKINKSRSEIDDLIQEHCSMEEFTLQNFWNNLTAYCKQSESHGKVNKWDFYNSIHFTYTVVSTIGYGNLVPITRLGRILMILYALIGIPMNGILLSQLGKYYGKVFVQAYKKYESYKSGRESPGKRLAKLKMLRASLAAQIFMYLTPGFLLFIFLPALLITYVENWPYGQSVYYAFVTLSTIGFGDYVAGQGNTEERGPLWIIYKIFLIFWIFFGLGYLVMIMDFISQGMRSKRVQRFEQLVAQNLEQTRDMILNEFNNMRRAFNELCFMKIEPVYRSDLYEGEIPMDKFPRSRSFPDLRDLEYGGFEPEMRIPQRKRSNSQREPEIRFEAMNRAVSESDLSMIDKKATFASNALMQPAALLAHLVLGFIPPSDEFKPSEQDTGQSSMKGVDGFSEKEITAGEKSWGPSESEINGDNLPKKLTRAASEIIFRNQDDGLGRHNRKSTWSETAATRRIQELREARQKSAASGMPASSLASVPEMIRPRWFNPFSSKQKNAGENLSTGESLPADETEMNLIKNCDSHTTNSRSIKNSDRDYSTHTEEDLRNPRGSNLLEETALADFLRAMTNLHSRIAAVSEDFVVKPHRKVGTAKSMTTTEGHVAKKRFSLKQDENSDAFSPSCPRRGFSLMSRIGSNRFPVRPDDNSNTVTSAYSQRGRSQLARAPGPRGFSLRPGFTSGGNWKNTPPYTADLVPLHIRERQNPPGHSTNPFMFEYPKEFPLRPEEIGESPAPGSPKVPPMDRPIPRWKDGMAQRQRSELSLWHRARTFSIGAVTAVKNDRHTSTSRTSSLGLFNAMSNRNLPTQTTEKFGDNKLTSVGCETLSHKKIDDVIQNVESNDEKRLEEAKTVGLESTDPFGFDILAETSAELTDSGLHRTTPVLMIKIEDQKATSDDQSLRSVVVDKPLSKPTILLVSSLLDSLHDVKIDSVDHRKPTSSDLQLDVSNAKKAISTISQHSVELGSSSSSCSGRSSRLKSVAEEPQVALMELKIEKPATNPFEQYKADVEKKAPGSREFSTSRRHSTVHETAETEQSESYRQILLEFEDSEA